MTDFKTYMEKLQAEREDAENKLRSQLSEQELQDCDKLGLTVAEFLILKKELLDHVRDLQRAADIKKRLSERSKKIYSMLGSERWSIPSLNLISKQNNYTRLDRDAMEADGLNLEPYTKIQTCSYIARIKAQKDCDK